MTNNKLILKSPQRQCGSLILGPTVPGAALDSNDLERRLNLPPNEFRLRRTVGDGIGQMRSLALYLTFVSSKYHEKQHYSCFDGG